MSPETKNLVVQTRPKTARPLPFRRGEGWVRGARWFIQGFRYVLDMEILSGYDRPARANAAPAP